MSFLTDGQVARITASLAAQVERSVVQEHERQLEAWRTTRGPRAAEPPAASPLFVTVDVV